MMTPHPPHPPQDAPMTDMTPDWSHALAEVCQSPYWRGLSGMARKEAFVDAASSYATYDDLPPRLQALFQRAQREQRAGRRTHTSRH